MIGEQDRRPILVTGSHRSGTTWVGRMLCLSREAGYIHEPFNPDRKPGWAGGRIPLWFTYVTESNESRYAPIIDEVLRFHYPLRPNLAFVRDPRSARRLALDLPPSLVARIRRPRPLLKDPIALFSAEWLAARYAAQVVVMIRHPAAFAASLKALSWHFKFRGWLAQPALLRDWLHPWEADMRRCLALDEDIIEEAIVMWNAMHDVIRAYQTRNPAWTFIRHEDLAREPLDGFRSLYTDLGLTFGPRVARAIEKHSRLGRPALAARHHGSVTRDSRAATTSWRGRLTEEEISRVREGTADVAPHFYAEDDWRPQL
jgi:Sulfotransferase family